MRLASFGLVLMLIGCSTNVNAPSPSVAASATPSATLATTPASGAPSPTSSPPAIGTPAPIKDLSDVFHPLVGGWRPTGPTLLFMVGSSSGATSRLVAQQIDNGQVVEILEVAGQPVIRADGGAVATTVQVGGDLRIATWDARTGTSAWVTPAGANASVAAWSKDGASVFYTTLTPGTDFKGVIHRIGIDGRGEAVVAMVDRFGDLLGTTPDGRGLILSRAQAGGSVDVIDIATGTDRHLADNARVASMRAKQPRLLMMLGGCCAGPGGGALVLWNDEALTSRELAPAGAPYLYAGASWDPTGTRIAAVRMDAAFPNATELVTIDPESGAQQVVPDTKDAAQVLWIDEGMIVSIGARRSPIAKVELLPARGGQAVPLDPRISLFGAVFVRP